MRIQLWSYNYPPEPTGIAPVSAIWSEGMRAAGHEVNVVAAHPHYPIPRWGRALRPYREVREGVPLLRLPLMIGRDTSARRIRQELSYMASVAAALPFLGRPEILVSVSPSFPALLPAMANARTRRLSWVLWLQDVLPDGALASGVIERGRILQASRWLERAAYRRAAKIVVVSQPFADNLLAKGVPAEKIELVYNPATRWPRGEGRGNRPRAPARILSMGNIGRTQGLPPLVSAFAGSPAVSELGVRLVITGEGVSAEEVRRAARGGPVDVLGLVPAERLERELSLATIALVSQSYEGTEFNLPSKLMTFMAYGLPILAAVNPASEVARIVRESGAGWVVDSSRPDLFPRAVLSAISDADDLQVRSAASADYAREHFSREMFVRRFERVLRQVAGYERDPDGIGPTGH